MADAGRGRPDTAATPAKHPRRIALCWETKNSRSCPAKRLVNPFGETSKRMPGKGKWGEGARSQNSGGRMGRDFLTGANGSSFTAGGFINFLQKKFQEGFGMGIRSKDWHCR